MSFGMETPARYSRDEIASILAGFDAGNEYGMILRAKGMVASDQDWIYFDYTPGETDIRSGSPEVTGKICVIGSKLNEEKLHHLFEKR